jgi:hypothetical protein
MTTRAFGLPSNAFHGVMGPRLTRRSMAVREFLRSNYLARDRREFITLLGGVVSVFLCVSAAAQEGYYGVGHDKWHQGFYSKLKRNDGQGSCCNLMDCRPTQSRMVGDHYEVKVDGAWTPVPYDKINNVVAPDGGADSASGHPVRANVVSISSILPLAGGHQHVADLLVTDGKIALPPPVPSP